MKNFRLTWIGRKRRKSSKKSKRCEQNFYWSAFCSECCARVAQMPGGKWQSAVGGDDDVSSYSAHLIFLMKLKNRILNENYYSLGIWPKKTIHCLGSVEEKKNSVWRKCTYVACHSYKLQSNDDKLVHTICHKGRSQRERRDRRKEGRQGEKEIENHKMEYKCEHQHHIS